MATVPLLPTNCLLGANGQGRAHGERSRNARLSIGCGSGLLEGPYGWFGSGQFGLVQSRTTSTNRHFSATAGRNRSRSGELPPQDVLRPLVAAGARNVGGRMRARVGAALSALLVVGVVFVTDAGPAHSAVVYQTNPFETAGTVVSTGAPAPNVSGATGSFKLSNLYRTGGNIDGAKDSSGNVTIYAQAQTQFYKSDGNGNYLKSTQLQVVVPGQ